MERPVLGPTDEPSVVPGGLSAAVRASVYVVVPAYREGSTASETVSRLRKRYENVVVIDDGSDDQTAEGARAAGATVLRHLINRGQGAALQTGILHALRRGAMFIVTFDADGQHETTDIEALLDPLVRGEADVTLGSRFLGQTDAPVHRKLLLRGGILFTRIVSRMRLTDTHNGLRGFTREAARRIDIRLDRMAHASEILDQISRNGLRWVEVPVRIRYTEYSRSKGQGASGALRIVWDFLMGRWLR